MPSLLVKLKHLRNYIIVTGVDLKKQSTSNKCIIFKFFLFIIMMYIVFPTYTYLNIEY